MVPTNMYQTYQHPKACMSAEARLQNPLRIKKLISDTNILSSGNVYCQNTKTKEIYDFVPYDWKKSSPINFTKELESRGIEGPIQNVHNKEKFLKFNYFDN